MKKETLDKIVKYKELISNEENEENVELAVRQAELQLEDIILNTEIMIKKLEVEQEECFEILPINYFKIDSIEILLIEYRRKLDLFKQIKERQF